MIVLYLDTSEMEFMLSFNVKFYLPDKHQKNRHRRDISVSFFFSRFIVTHPRYYDSLKVLGFKTS